MQVDHVLSAPGLHHWFGTDSLGRDVLSRVLYGARISLGVSVLSVAIALVLGTAIGLTAGYFGRWVDGTLSRLVDLMFSFPDILLALVVIAILGGSLLNLTLAIGIVYTPIFARIARGAVLVVRRADYVEAARATGAGDLRVMLRHILPNIFGPIMVQTSLSLAFAVLAEAALTYLGLGAEPDTPSWGMMLNQGTAWMQQAWWVAVFPGLAITVTVLGFNLLGDGLGDALDPTLRGAGR
jgi:peptide/nickel transport system permease protein